MSEQGPDHPQAPAEATQLPTPAQPIPPWPDPAPAPPPPPAAPLAAPPYAIPSAPPAYGTPSAPPAYGTPWAPPAYGPPGVPPTPAKGRAGKVLAIVGGVVALVAVVSVVAALVVVPKLTDRIGAVASASPSPTRDLNAVPAVGSCWQGDTAGEYFNGRAEFNAPADCATVHRMETIASGKIDTRPDNASAPYAADLYAACEDAAEEYLGQPWTTTYTWLVLAVPSKTQWAEGTHWYRCDLMITAGWGWLDLVPLTGTVKNSAKSITCVTWTAATTGRGWSDDHPADCDAIHNGELAGVVRFPEDADRADHDAMIAKLAKLCDRVINKFLDRSSLPKTLTYWMLYPNGTVEEGVLNQTVSCVLAAADPGKKLIGSLQGIGNKPIPFV